MNERSAMKAIFITLALLSVTATASAEVCDPNADGQIDKRDLAVISKARGQYPAPNDPRDANQDGAISPADVQVCIRLCDLPGCAINQ